MTTIRACYRTDCMYHMDTVFAWESWCMKDKVVISQDGKCKMFERKKWRD
jgi:hypothetical protein